ncbi:MAG TPA: hypothetical protein VFI15_09950, partial [Candidatus Limnocylindrales bacterium]|nr:hypothetical protein [Candidatus Limnocylindrales bacterium]
RPAIPPALFGQPVRWAVPRAGRDGTLRIGIGGPDRAPARIDDDDRHSVRQGFGFAVELPIATDRNGTLAGGVLRLSGSAGSFDLPASFDGSIGRVVVGTTDGPDAIAVPRGRYEITAHLGGPAAPAIAVGAASVREDGRFDLLGLRRVNRLTRLRTWASWSTRTAADSTRTRALNAVRRLPTPAKDVLRSMYGRLRS